MIVIGMMVTGTLPIVGTRTAVSERPNKTSDAEVQDVTNPTNPITNVMSQGTFREMEEITNITDHEIVGEEAVQ